jgi:hypothetical protein
MGSGHFLTKAIGYLAERVMERVRELKPRPSSTNSEFGGKSPASVSTGST